MNTYFLLFLVSAGSSVTLTPIVRRLSERMGWLDEPRDDRRLHQRGVPRLGGVSIFASVLIALVTLIFLDNLVRQSLVTNKTRLLITFVPAMLIFIFGLYDDLRGSSARLKFIAQGLAGAFFYVLGGRIDGLSVPLIGTVELHPALGFVVTVVWVVGITNAFNLIDGLDGLAAGAGLFASIVMLVVSLLLGNQLVTVISLAMAGALIGFLRYNFNPASIFLGDSGSLFIGFTLASLSVQGTQKASTVVAVTIPLLAFGVPVIDTGFTMARRLISGRPLFKGDREHIHHMLLARGWSQRRVALALYGVCALFGLLAMFFVSATERAIALVLFIVGAAVVLAIGRLRYHEVDEIKAGMRRNLTERRRRTANNIRVRRASRAMSQAGTLGEIFSAVGEMLELGEFVYAAVQLGRSGGAAESERALAREKGSRSLSGAEMRGGFIHWSWERGVIEAAEVIGSERFWALHLPLSTERSGWGYINLYRELDREALLVDVNYLCNLFQREMALAAERVLGAKVEESGEGLLTLSAAGGD